MEMDPESFEKLTNTAQNEERSKTLKSKEIESKWAKLEAKVGK